MVILPQVRVNTHIFTIASGGTLLRLAGWLEEASHPGVA